jgi:BirA family biotin operon repressor/biotin-[acetyl-CoA-carboxylase] ligase
VADSASGAPGEQVSDTAGEPTSGDPRVEGVVAQVDTPDAPASDPSATDLAPATESAGPEPRTSAHGFPRLETETVERFGRPMRLFPVAVSSEAMALSWANQEDAPQGATVVVDHEIRASGLHGRLWSVPSADSLACSVVLRPVLKMEEADTAWLVAAWAAAEGAQAVSGRELATWWPDAVVDAATREQVSAVRAEIQLGPGRVKSVVITMRFDLPGLGLDASRKDDLLEAVVHAVDAANEELAGGALGAAAAYEKRCALLGNRLMIRLLPKGETRGTAKRIDRSARLELESPSGLVEKITVDQVRDMKIV